MVSLNSIAVAFPKPVIRFLFSVLVGAFFVGCNSDEYDIAMAENLKASNKLNELRTEESLLWTEQSDLRQLISEFETLQRKEGEVLAGAQEIEEYKKALEAVVKHLSPQLATWLSATRSSLIGETLEAFRLSDGRTISDAGILDLSGEIVILRHGGRDEQFDLAGLPKAVQKKLIFEPAIELEVEIDN